jgi:3-hydroxybutyryl-CoA dehydratase
LKADSSDTISYDRSVVGVDYDLGSHLVTEESILGFAKTLGETNPLYMDPAAAKTGPYGVLIAPPTYYVSISLNPGLDPKIQFGTAGFNASQSCEFYEPMRVGDTITAKGQISDIFTKTGRTGTMVFTVRRNTYTNQHGRTVLVVESSNVLRDMTQ